MIALRKLIGSVLVVTMLLAVLLPLAPSLGVSAAKSASGTDNHAADNTDTSNVKAITYTDSSGNEVTISVAEINAQREELRAEAIAELADTGVFDDSFVQALTDLYSTYDEDMYIWLANLYDPSIGGFYYSNSARDNVGFLPDLESTAQALELLDKSGLDGVYNDIIGETLSDETRLQLYLFAHSLYNSSDGYYYHPQWGTSISSSRKGRDKGWGNDILNAFDPNTDGDSNVYTYSASASGETVLTAHLGVSDSTAASKVVSAVANGSVSTVAAASSSSVSFSCESWEDLKAYVDFWIFTKKDSYTMGNTINANVSAITNAGLRDDLTEYLAQIQYDNGLWEEETTYNAINGLMKLCGIFGGSYISFPNATEAVKSLLSILIGEIDDDGSLSAEGLAETKTIVYVYNPWVAMYKLVGAVNNEGNKAEISAMLKQYAPELMGNVTEKLKAFKRDDGGFSYFQNKTADKAQGSPVAIAGTCESDINSTGISISTLRYVLRVYQLYCNYDFEIPVLYFEADREYFLSILESRTPVEKIVVVEHPESVTFDDESYIDESVADEEDAEAGIIGNGGVLLNPYTGVSSNVGDNTANENGNYKWFSSSIVPSPTDASNKVLYAATYIDADGSYASSASNTQFNIVNSGVSGNTYVFEADIYVDSSTLANGSAKCIAQILIGNKYTSLYAETLDVYLVKADDGSATLYIQESTYYLGSDAVRTRLASDISADEWFTLRIELTKDYSDDGATLEAMLISTYIDGEQTSDNVNTGRFASDGGYYDYDINSVRIAYYRSTPSRIYLDNVYAAKVSSEGSVSDYYPGSSFDHYGVDPDEIKDSLEGTYDIGSFNITFFRDNSEGYLMKVEANAVTLYYTYDATQNADGSITVSPTYYSRVGEAGIEKNECYEQLTYSAISTEYGFAFIIVGDDDHLCDICGELLSSCADNDKNAVCDVCGGAAITATIESTDCSFGSNVLFKTAHAADGLTLTPVYSGNVYTLDFWCVYRISGSTVTLIATFESGASYTVSEAGIYRITPVFLATTLAGVTDNTYTADTTTTDKTTSDNCLTEEWANVALSGKFNVYSSSSVAPLKTSNVTQLYVVADPANASNNVLAWMTSGTSGTGYGNAVVSFNLDNTLNGSSYVIDFDYYVDYTYFSGASLYTAIGVSGASSSYELARINHGGAAMANYSLKPDNVVTPGSSTSYFTLSTRTSAAASSGKKAVYDTDTWYSVKVVIENDTVYTFFALRGTDEYILVDSQAFSGINSAEVNTFSLTAGIYKNRSVILYDNISFYSIDTAPCIDCNTDCLCDICGASMCIDDNNDHSCDVCGNIVSVCADNNGDHRCDICGAILSVCEDGNGDHLCDLCGKVISGCADNDKNAVCDLCGEAAITAVTESTDCSFGGVLFKTAHAKDGLRLIPIYGGEAYTLDFWCVYKISGSTVTLIATFESGASYTVYEAGIYRITPVFLATTLAGVTDNTFTADTTTTDKTTSDKCLTEEWANSALSGKFNVYSSSSTAPLKTSNVTQLYVVADLANASNNVLAWMTSGTSGTGYGNAVVSFDLDDTVIGSNYIIEFDYYLDYSYYSGASLYTSIGVTDSSENAYELARLNHGNNVTSPVPDNTVYGQSTSYYSISTRTATGAASNKKVSYLSDTWYSVKMVITNDNVYTFFGARGSEEYTLVDVQSFAGLSLSDLSSLTLTAGIYKNRSVIYYDNISFYTSDSLPCIDTNRDHKCDFCGETLSACIDSDSNCLCDICGASSCADDDKNAVCDICGEAAVTAYLGSIDCSFAGGEVIAAVHAGEGLTLTPVYSDNVYTLDFWCVYRISGSTVTLIATFEAGASYTVSEAGIYRITPVFLATTLAGVTENTYTADTTTTDKTTSDNCLTEEWANVALSGKFNVYSSSSVAPLKTSNVTQLYVVADPANASNNVLAWMTSGTSGTGYGNAVVSFELDNTVNGGKHVIEFDYYVDYTYFSGASLYTAIGVSGASSSYELARINHGGAAMANYSLNPDNVVTPGSATSYFSLSTRTSSGAASNKKAVYDTDTWYSVRVVVENDTVNTYLALRGTNEYTLVDSQIFSGISSAGLSTLTLNAGIYKNRSVIYYDNISFYTAE